MYFTSYRNFKAVSRILTKWSVGGMWGGFLDAQRKAVRMFENTELFLEKTSNSWWKLSFALVKPMAPGCEGCTWEHMLHILGLINLGCHLTCYVMSVDNLVWYPSAFPGRLLQKMLWDENTHLFPWTWKYSHQLKRIWGKEMHVKRANSPSHF